MNLKAIINSFKTSKTKSFDDHDEDIVKGIVSRLSEGSISLQLSRYATESDITKRAEKVFRHNFCK